MKKLTLKELREVKPNTIFRSGNFLYDGQWWHWIAARGTIPDWAIYYGGLMDSEEHIHRVGHKLHSIDYINKLVPCQSMAVLRLYRV